MKEIIEKSSFPDISISEPSSSLPVKEEEDWTLIIRPQASLFDLQLAELWRYRDLILLFVRRDFVTFYKQTVLGPLWFFIQPILTTFIFAFIFGRVANLAPSGVPHVLFYLSGIVLWNYFSECVNRTSGTFTQNAEIFGKVYFPRIVMPLSIVISNLIRLGIQLLLFALTWMFFVADGMQVKLNAYALLFPLLVLIMAGLGLGLGMIISSMTTKYRDLTFLITFGIQLAMYASPVIFPVSSLEGDLKLLILANPMSGVIESFYGYI